MLLWLSSRHREGEASSIEEVVDLSDDVAFEAADGVAFCLAFAGPAGNVGDGRFVELHPGNHRAVDRGVQLAVATAVDAVLYRTLAL